MRMRHAAVVAGLALGLMSGTAKASVTIDIKQMGNDVITSGTGSIDLTGLVSAFEAYTSGGAVRGTGSYVESSTPDEYNFAAYYGLIGPSSIGPGTTYVNAQSSSGDDFAFSQEFGELFLPIGYKSGGSLTFGSVFSNQTLSSLGLTSGTYVFSTVGGEALNLITVNVGDVSAVPLPASAPMFGAALLALGAVGYGVKRKKTGAAA